MDISDQANVNRSTFYAHYCDKEDLLEKIISDKLELLASQTSHCFEMRGQSLSFNTPDLFFVTLFEHISEHEPFYRVMLIQWEHAQVRTRMQEIIKDGFYIRISRLDLSQKLQVPLDLLLEYVSSSALGIINKWLAENRVYSPHYMALQLTRLSSPISGVPSAPLLVHSIADGLTAILSFRALRGQIGALRQMIRLKRCRSSPELFR